MPAQAGHNLTSSGVLARLQAALEQIPHRVIACSGGIDSLLLATVAHRASPDTTVVAHTVTPAVPGAATARVMAFARREGWKLEIVRSREFDDERYLSNPTNRCYFCKTNLYDALDEVRERAATVDATVMSGANTDDLGEYRPGLEAAKEHGVAHPYLVAGIAKSDIRAIARSLGLSDADLPASPCLASRLYTGTRVTASRLHAVEVGEAVVTETTGISVVRCRVRDNDVLVEVPTDMRELVTRQVLADVEVAMRSADPEIGSVALDDRAYRSGRAILQVT